RVKDRTRRSRLTRILESEPPCAREEFARRLPIPQLGLGLEPPMTIGVEDRSTIREPLLVSEIFLVPPSIPLVGAPEPPVWEPDQRLFHRPDVPGRQPPVRAQGPQIEDSISVDSPGAIHVRVHVGEHETADRAEGRLSTVGARVPRSRNRSELASCAEQEDDVLVAVLHVELENSRGV